MVENVDPFSFIGRDSIDDELEKAIRDPFSINFRPTTPKEWIEISSEDTPFNSINVDVVNTNVEVRYAVQEEEEKYITVAQEDGVSIVESHAVISPLPDSDQTLTTPSYYLVTDEEELFYDSEGYIESPIRRPREVASYAPSLLRRAEKLDSYGFEPASELQEDYASTRTVPPPQKDPLYED